MFKFKSFKISIKSVTAAHLRLSLQILKLAYVWRNSLFDDLAHEKYGNFYELIKNLTNRTYPYFWAIFKNDGTFCGFAYLYDIMKPMGKKPYSACVTVCLERPFWGAQARICAGEFFEFCALLGIRRLKAQCFERNRLARKLLKSAGFKCEGILKREAFVRGALENLVFYGKEV